jgi:dTDP-4-dehydrorhamnose reductase
MFVHGNNNDSALIVGADGTIGWSIAAALESTGKMVWKTTRRRDEIGGQRIFLDLSQDVAIWPLPPVPIKTAILCAAVTSLERCRLDPVSSTQVNVVSTIALARRLIAAGAFVVFLSTNLVFSGKTPFAKPTDPVNPRTEYGRQKAEAESQLLVWREQTSIVRFSKVLSPDMRLFQDWIRDLKAGKAIYPFSDMVMAPVLLSFAVKVLLEVVGRRAPGIFQVSATQDISYAAAAQHIAQKLDVGMELVQPISYSEPGLAFAPLYTSLDSSRLTELGLHAPDPSDVFEQFVVPDYILEVDQT